MTESSWSFGDTQLTLADDLGYTSFPVELQKGISNLARQTSNLIPHSRETSELPNLPCACDKPPNLPSPMTIEEHYNAIAPKLTNWLVASGSSYHDACDLVQRTFVKIWEMRDDLREDDGAVSGLAFTIARNLRKNLWRDNKRTVLTDTIPEDAAVDDSNTLAPSDAEYLRRRLSEAFAQLPPILRDAYTMFQVGEMSIKDIAAQTGVSENLVKVRIFRAKQKLREILDDLRVTF